MTTQMASGAEAGVTLGTYLDPADAAAIRARADADDRPVSYIIRRALREAGYLSNDERRPAESAAVKIGRDGPKNAAAV